MRMISILMTDRINEATMITVRHVGKLEGISGAIDGSAVVGNRKSAASAPCVVANARSTVLILFNCH